jgi:hypothetical protein
VRYCRLCAEQDRLPDTSYLQRRGGRIRHGEHGLGTAEFVLEDSELDELEAALRAFDQRRPTPESTAPVDPSPRGDTPDPDPAHGPDSLSTAPVDPSPRGDSPDADPEPGEDLDPDETASDERGWVTPVPPYERRANALMDLIRTALAHIGDDPAAGGDRYLIHYVYDAATDTSERLDGTPVTPAEAGRIRCDANRVNHHVGEAGEPLNLGRKTRKWSTAQHRAIAVRDHGTCRFPGCDHTIGDIHHLHYWEADGPTDINNGLFLCARHHTLTHAGYTATGNASAKVTFHRPDGTVIGTTAPYSRTFRATRAQSSRRRTTTTGQAE